MGVRGRRSWWPVVAAVVGVVVLAATVVAVVDGPERTEPLAFGVTTPGGATAAAELDAVEAAVGERPSLVLTYADFTTPPPVADLDAVAARGAVPVVTWEPWDWDAPASGAFGLAAIAAGAHDPHLRQWADALRTWGRPVQLRFAHEQNGDWYPWAVGVSGTTAADHVAAFRHVVEVFDAQGAGNVQFVWNPNVRFPGSSPMAETWPGTRYVDRVALDGYNWGTSSPGHRWQEPEEVFGDSLDELRELAPGIPITVTEVASAEEGGDKADWVTDLVAYLDEQADVAAFVWFDHDKEADWRITSSPASAAAMRAALAGRRLVAR
ncbi:Glycosyl hydrolase family 26 [Geodermatophilus poikilotrophus]|uniref:Glycosyl hydrolase family 26 n=1 Tax=Geodermatophilus poikilotrophus TaxID=1333667 RepID=A0A1I0HXC2_9ACTN|nr:Glycosyl hydrolase family 26 [Geodermatophilus poikilotrophus]